MKKTDLAYSDLLKLDRLQNACLEVDKSGQALILAYAQGYAAAKKEIK